MIHIITSFSRNENIGMNVFCYLQLGEDYLAFNFVLELLDTKLDKLLKCLIYMYENLSYCYYIHESSQK